VLLREHVPKRLETHGRVVAAVTPQQRDHFSEHEDSRRALRRRRDVRLDHRGEAVLVGPTVDEHRFDGLLRVERNEAIFGACGHDVDAARGEVPFEIVQMIGRCDNECRRIGGESVADEFGDRCNERIVALVELDEVPARRGGRAVVRCCPAPFRSGLFGLQVRQRPLNETNVPAAL
jgi:hypothetical protein